MRSSFLFGRFLLWLSLFAFSCSELPLHGGPGAVRAWIDSAEDAHGESEDLMHLADGRKVILFGEESERVRFHAILCGPGSAGLRCYWTFTHAAVARYPAHGVTDRVDTPPIKFAVAGTAHLHVVSMQNPGSGVADDTVTMCHLHFEEQPLRDADGKIADYGTGGPLYGYIPENSWPDDRDNPEVRMNYVLWTDPPLARVYLGRLTTSKPRTETLLPPYAITDLHGRFPFSASARNKDKYWGAVLLPNNPVWQNPATIQKYQAKNDAIRSLDEELQIEITADPVVLYKNGVDERSNGVEVIRAFRLHLPDDHVRRLICLLDPEKGIMKAELTDARRKYHAQVVAYHLPKAVTDALAAVNADDLGRYMWYHERNQWRAEDGEFYVQIPKVEKVTYTPPDGERLEAVTFLPRNGVLAAVIDLEGGKAVLRRIDVESGRVLSEASFGQRWVDRLAWMNDDWVLSTESGRHESSCAIWSISQEKELFSAEGEPIEYYISADVLMEYNHETFRTKRLFP